MSWSSACRTDGRAGQRTSRIPMDLFHTHVSPRSVELAAEALRSTFVSEGRRVREFEARLASELGLANPAAVNSGTAALHLALDVAGVGPGDEVILPAQ